MAEAGAAAAISMTRFRRRKLKRKIKLRPANVALDAIDRGQKSEVRRTGGLNLGGGLLT
ncbi:MAG: hypothetical protein HYX79_09260 [Chloroflexi bacterium]|nr:hypothetical protein [Chloroflexota bacterium]